MFFLKGVKGAECSETPKYAFRRISSYFELFTSKSYVLDHSEFYAYRKEIKNCRCPQKTRFLLYGGEGEGGGSESNGSDATVSFLRLTLEGGLLFFYRLRIRR